jgi:hypothetical protein
MWCERAPGAVTVPMAAAAARQPPTSWSPRRGGSSGYGTRDRRGTCRTWHRGRGQLNEVGRRTAVKLTGAAAFSGGIRRGMPLEVAIRVLRASIDLLEAWRCGGATLSGRVEAVRGEGGVDGGRRRGGGLPRLPATRWKRSKTFATVWCFFRNQRMDRELTSGDEFGGEVGGGTIHPRRGENKNRRHTVGLRGVGATSKRGGDGAHSFLWPGRSGGVAEATIAGLRLQAA